MKTTPYASQKKVAITLPTEGIDFAFLGIGSPFVIHCCDFVWSQQYYGGPKSHQWLWINAKILLHYSYRVLNNQLKHPYDTVFGHVSRCDIHLVHNFVIHKYLYKILCTCSNDVPILCYLTHFHSMVYKCLSLFSFCSNTK